MRAGSNPPIVREKRSTWTDSNQCFPELAQFTAGLTHPSLDIASGAGQNPLEPLPPSPPRNAALPALGPFERDLLLRYIDLPFNRMNNNGSGFVSAEEPNDAGVGGGKGKGTGRYGMGGARGVPGFSAVDEDESESGVFSDKDFRNMSLKVRPRIHASSMALLRWLKSC